MKFKSIFTILCVLAVSTSCTKILDTEPTNFSKVDNYYSTEEELQFALNGVYDNLGSYELYGRDMLYAWNAQTDEAVFNIYLSSHALAYAYYDYNSSTPEIRAFWSALYKGIFRANMLLANIDKPKMAESRRKIIKGEALFLRGYYYFLLASNFGSVPLILEPTNSVTNVEVPKTPLADVYAQVLKDMTTAESLLQAQTATSLGFAGKVSKTAVQGVLARVCLQMAGEPLKDRSKYQDAKNWAYKVITSGEHQLNKDYTDVFIKLAKDQYDVKESIWEVEFYGNGSETSEGNSFYSLVGILNQNPNDQIVGYNSGRMYATQTLYKLYGKINQTTSAVINPTLDLRRDWNCANYYYTTSGVKTVEPNRPAYKLYMGKWRREYETFVPKTRVSPMNVSLLRYSDVLLMYAEAANELSENGVPDSAYTAINLVRRRAYGKELNGNVLKEIKITGAAINFPDGVPTVTLEGGGATTPATATAVINSSKNLTSITINTRGQFYTSAPIVKLNGVVYPGVEATISSMDDA
ncbi:RagB/SusD family nutrient uptake outer membrane protein, partial [Pseudoxanthomonas sp. SGD-10]